MTKQDKITTLFGIGLNVVVIAIIFFAVTNYIA